MGGPDVFPDLVHEQDRLEFARACRLAMIDRYQKMLTGELAADEITGEYVETVLWRALADLEPADAADFFGRIDNAGGDVFRIGKRHIDDGDFLPVVVDWRAGVAAPFYRATVLDPFDLTLRRRYSLREGELIGYNDEHLDDAEGAAVAGGIPDPVLAEMGAARTGSMREIVATIQAEQDHVIRAPLDTCLVVQGGPGTGKTAVGLHRAAYLLFEHRDRLEQTGVLVVGPNRVFLAYIADVLPSLGERSVQQRTLADLTLPKVDVTATDPPEVAVLKGDTRLATVLERAALARIRLPDEPVRFGHGLRHVTIEPVEIAEWVADALAGRTPLNRRREGFRGLATQEIGRHLTGPGGDRAPMPKAAKAMLDKAWPVVKPLDLVTRLLTRPAELAAAALGLLTDEEQAMLRKRAGHQLAWTPDDLPLLDEAMGQLDGPPFRFGHVVVDEAQDLSPMALRMIARRCPSRSLTILGDLAQSTAPAATSNWAAAMTVLTGGNGASEVAELTIGYRVPAPILDVANRLLAEIDVDVPPSRSARLGGDPPEIRSVSADERWTAVARAVTDLRTEGHTLTGVIVPPELRAEAHDALFAAGLSPVDHLDGLHGEVPLLAADAAKGLELDGVVVVEPGEIAAGTTRGTRLLYVALTRAVQRLVIVNTGPLPAALSPVPPNPQN